VFVPKRPARPRREHQFVSADENPPESVRLARLRLADVATELGTDLVRHGRHAEAEALLRRAISIYESSDVAKECEK
jgi:hypothetical protein